MTGHDSLRERLKQYGIATGFNASELDRLAYNLLSKHSIETEYLRSRLHQIEQQREIERWRTDPLNLMTYFRNPFWSIRNAIASTLRTIADIIDP